MNNIMRILLHDFYVTTLLELISFVVWKGRCLKNNSKIEKNNLIENLIITKKLYKKIRMLQNH